MMVHKASVDGTRQLVDKAVKIADNARQELVQTNTYAVGIKKMVSSIAQRF